MNKKQEKIIKENLDKAFEKISITMVAKGYKEALFEIKEQIDKGGSLQEIYDYCNTIIGANNDIIKVATKEKEE